MQIENTCAFTGHRPQSFAFGTDEIDERCLYIKARIAEEIERMLGRGVTVFISGMAEGVDTWAAEAVLELRMREPSVKLVAAVPYKGYETGRRFRQERYQKILALCDSIEYASEGNHRGVYIVRDRMMVDNAAHLIAVYNGKASGGTAYTIDYAKKQGRDVVIIDV